MRARWRSGRALARYVGVTRVPMTVVQLVLIPGRPLPLLFDPPSALSDLIDTLSAVFWVPSSSTTRSG